MNIAVRIDSDEAIREANETPLELLNPGRADRFQNDTILPVFARLRKEDPVHFTAESDFGPYWSVTRWKDIMAVDTNHEIFSSAQGITLPNLVALAEQQKVLGELARPRTGGGAGFITMDEPQHGAQRKAVSPTVAPANLQRMAPIVRERAGLILDSLPIGKEFDWVDLVSKELTAMTLATLFDFPFEDRRKLTYWSDMVTNPPGHGPVQSWEHKFQAMGECFGAFEELWNQKVNAEPSADLISMLVHNPATRDMDRDTYRGNVILLIVGGNDTTRNTISGSVVALNQFPEQYAKLRANPGLITSMVSETIRWQTPLAHMARVAKSDFELGGKTIKAGERVVMWYLSGNRDEDEIENPNSYIIDRDQSRHHMSFGFGVHRCVGNRVAELQLTIIWEEILKRFPEIRVSGEPVRNYSAFVHGFETLPVIIPSRN